MISKDNVITLAWLTIGEQSQMYNGNITDRQKVAEFLLDAVIRNTASDTNFLFNSKKIKLHKNADEINYDGDFRYNIPVDFLNKIWLSDVEARFEHEFIYSKSDDLEMAYCYSLPLSEFPDYMETYLTVELGKKLCVAYDTFNNKLSYLLEMSEDEKARILKMEGLPFRLQRG
ncbi:MAG: hypothetical protein ACRCZ9_03920 [Fusobacteriaceae bacterium]